MIFTKKLKKCRNLILTLSRKIKDSYFKRFFEVKQKKDDFKIWQGISELVKTKPRKRPKSLHANKRVEENSLKIASEFNSFFNTTAAKMMEN